ncbi:ATP-binding protein [Tepidamorphus sp. 3E244]|uniref:ATP-binding protein n=1 Tax=Tepidamorphus sp. 3E244 TaxID=3385498 RepID=UPI0038FC2CEF
MTTSTPTDQDALLSRLDRITEALERAYPPQPQPTDMGVADAFVWSASEGVLKPVQNVNRVAIDLLKGVDRAKDLLFDNTLRFARGFSANNALLWGARGMGKSSLVKACHAAINAEAASHGIEPGSLKLIEIHREDIDSLPLLLSRLRDAEERFLIFCDDLSFDGDDTSYKSLKAALEGGLEGRPTNVLFYATSNRRHLLPRDMMENERSTAINPSEAVEEKVSLSDRFGLWLGFHKCSQDEYLEMVDAYAERFGLKVGRDELHRDALEWSTTRGARSGRVAWQFIQDVAGRLEVRL